MTVSVFIGKISENADKIRQLSEVVKADVYIRNMKGGRKTIGCSVKFCRPNGEILVEIPFKVPESFELTETNWPEMFRLERSIGARYRYKTDEVKVFGPSPKTISFNNRNEGMLFEVEMEDKTLYGVYIIDPNDTAYPVFQCRGAVMIQDDSHERKINFTPKNLRLTNSGEITSYILPFKKPMGPEEVLRRWVEYDNRIPSDPSFYVTESPSPIMFTAHSFFGFHYFTAFNRKVVFTLQKNASLFALSAVMRYIQKMEDSSANTAARLRTLTEDVQRLLENEHPNKVLEILKYAVEAHENMLTLEKS